MSPTHQSAKAIFLAALDQATADRPAYLDAACGDDVALRGDVDSLLAFHDAESSAAGLRRYGQRRDFVPGFVFAGRYRIVSRLGRGGMGEVWRADDLVLDTPVALKLIHSSSPAAREQLLQEVRLARQITHPAVCRVYDIGLADDDVFFSMELVDGQDLASLVRQAGRLAPHKVAEVAWQLCDGLAAAHAQGVLHRDLKPANVMLGHDGRIRITDFGIAVSTAGPAAHGPAGTPLYMAPEQRADGALTPQTDLFGLGLVLYELATGRHPFGAAGVESGLAPPSAFAPDLDPTLDRLIVQMLALSPGDRPASAAAAAAMLPTAVETRAGGLLPAPSTGPRPVRRSGAWLAASAVAAVTAAIAAAVLFSGRPTRALSEQDTIVLADVANRTDEPLFDGALKVALAVALEQSPFLRVFPDERVRDTLRLMQRPADTRVTAEVAREIATREHLAATLAGSIAPLGRHYVIALEAISAPTGEVIAREQVEADGKEQVLASLGTAATALRERLGESLASVRQYDAPLPRATTPSLEALNAYARALEGGPIAVRAASIPHLVRAIELDPDFALAHALLSGVYANRGREAQAPAHARRAFALRSRVSERERYSIEWRYYRDALQDWRQGLEVARAWTVAYPRDPFAFNSLGIAALSYGLEGEGITALREAIRLDPRFLAPYGNLGVALLAAGRPDEVTALVTQARAAGVTYISLQRLEYLVAVAAGDLPGMAAAREAALATSESADVADWNAKVAAAGGRLTAAHDEFQRAVRQAEQQNLPEWIARFAIGDAMAHALLGRCEIARPDVTTALARSRTNTTLESASRILALCNEPDASAALDAELAQRFPQATMPARLSLPLNGATRAIRAGGFDRALAELDKIGPLERSSRAELWPAFLRGRARAGKSDAVGAVEAFSQVIDRRGEAADSLLHPLALLERARVWSRSGAAEKARADYQTLHALWRDADAALPQVVEVRRAVGAPP